MAPERFSSPCIFSISIVILFSVDELEIIGLDVLLDWLDLYCLTGAWRLRLPNSSRDYSRNRRSRSVSKWANGRLSENGLLVFFKRGFCIGLADIECHEMPHDGTTSADKCALGGTPRSASLAQLGSPSELKSLKRSDFESEP